MASDDRISLLVREAQKRIFRLAERDHGLTLKAIGLDSGIAYNTVRTYASGESIMPITAVLRLVGVIPDELLSHLTEPVGRHIAENESDDGDLGALAVEASGYTAEFVAAEADGVITPFERGKLKHRARRMATKAKAAAA